jgi:hypothetical protein
MDEAPLTNRAEARRWRIGAGLAAGLACIVAIATLSARVLGQAAAPGGTPPRGPLKWTVGRGGALAYAPGVDAAHTGSAPFSLPTSRLRVAWSTHVQYTLHPLLIEQDGTVITVSPNGIVAALNDEGRESWSFSGPARASHPVLLSDGAVAYVDQASLVTAVRRGTPAFTTKPIGLVPPTAHFSALLPLRDGGFVAVVGAQAAWFDGRGAERERGRLPAGATTDGDLVSNGRSVYAVTSRGRVYELLPGNEAKEVGFFGGPIGNVAFADPDTMVAVVDNRALTRLSIGSGARSEVPGFEAADFVFGSPAAAGKTTCTFSSSLLKVFATCADTAGAVTRTGILTRAAGDGGALAPLAAEQALLIDAAGTVAYSVPRKVGVITKETGISSIDAGCSGFGGMEPGFMYLSPGPDKSFFGVCADGEVFKFVGK